MQELPLLLLCLKNADEAADLHKKMMADNRIIAVHSEKDLLSYLATNEFDVLIIDLNFENADTLSICKELRAGNRSFPFIIIAGEASEDYIKTIAFEAGADDYLEKPLNPVLVSARIRAMMRRKKKGPARPHLTP